MHLFCDTAIPLFLQIFLVFTTFDLPHVSSFQPSTECKYLDLRSGSPPWTADKIQLMSITCAHRRFIQCYITNNVCFSNVINVDFCSQSWCTLTKQSCHPFIPSDEVTMEEVGQSTQLRAGELIIIVVVLIMWAGEDNTCWLDLISGPFIPSSSDIGDWSQPLAVASWRRCDTRRYNEPPL